MIDFCVSDIIRKQLDRVWKKVAMSAAEPETDAKWTYGEILRIMRNCNALLASRRDRAAARHHQHDGLPPVFFGK